MSSPDQLLFARLDGIAHRHTARGRIDDRDRAVAELRAVVGDRRDLLAELAGVALGVAEAGFEPLAPQHRAMAELAIAAGADEAQIERWVEVGRQRAEQARQTPYAGGSGLDLVAVASGDLMLPALYLRLRSAKRGCGLEACREECDTSAGRQRASGRRGQYRRTSGQPCSGVPIPNGGSVLMYWHIMATTPA